MDIQTGINAGMRTALVLTGEAGKDQFDVTPDLVCRDLLEAVEKILEMDWRDLMIITQTPFRMSFFGGGTDFPDKEHGGAVISTT